MKEKHIYTIETLPVGKTDWSKVAKLADKEIEKAARSDKDASLTTKKQLAKFTRVHKLTAKDIRGIREKTHMSQGLFAAYFGISVRTLQEWEQGRRHPHGPACTLLMIIDANPKVVARVLCK